MQAKYASRNHSHVAQSGVNDSSHTEMLASVGGSKKRILSHDSEEKAGCKGQCRCGNHLGRALVEHVALTTALVTAMAQSRTCAARDDHAEE
jgi:hypothetical protein